jgi:hypothetical protein
MSGCSCGGGGATLMEDLEKDVNTGKFKDIDELKSLRNA